MFAILLLIIVGGYLIGCIHGSNLAFLISGVNLKKEGFGNAGASNATLTLGWKYGILVALVDIGKGIIAIVLCRYLLNEFSSFTDWQISLLLYITGAMVILGHNFPFHMKFKGGKGTASIIGIFVALNWKFGLLAVLLLILTSIVTNYLIIGVFIFYAFFVVSTFILEPSIWPFVVTIILLILAVYLHLENFKRIRLGTEPKVLSAFKKKKS